MTILNVLLIGPPGPPQNPEVKEITKAACIVSWQPPIQNGGTQILGYWVERRLTSSNRWLKINKEIVKELTQKITDLVESNEYEFRISAENKAGVGEPSKVTPAFMAKDPWGKFCK